MRVGVMQPYFFPYTGHFSLIAHCDEWIVFDISQYTPKSWMSRNRVLHPNGGPNWVSVPLSNGSISIRTSEARILDPVAARDTILGKLTHYRRKAPFHSAVERIVRETFDLLPGDCSLTHLNVRGLDAVCRYLGLPFKRRIASEIELDLPTGLGAGDWALAICQRLDASAYLNPLSGRALFDEAKFRAAGIELAFLRAPDFAYATGPFEPVPSLSILDALMWNEPAVVLDAIRKRAEILPARDTSAA